MPESKKHDVGEKRGIFKSRKDFLQPSRSIIFNIKLMKEAKQFIHSIVAISKAGKVIVYRKKDKIIVLYISLKHERNVNKITRNWEKIES